MGDATKSAIMPAEYWRNLYEQSEANLAFAKERLAELIPVKQSWVEMKRELDLQREINVELMVRNGELCEQVQVYDAKLWHARQPEPIQEIEERLRFKGVTMWGKAYYLDQPASLRQAALHAIECWRIVQGVPE